MRFEEAHSEAISFRDERDWRQFHNPKDLALSISIEAAELLQCFQWSGADLAAEDKKAEICDELADVLIYVMYMADALDVDAADIVERKLEKNAAKYPIEKAKGNSKKYTQL